MTILFEQDWTKYSRAIIDYKTPNRSALDLAAKLRMMGVKNNAFFLSLLNPDLQGVDPYSPNLTLEQMTLIGVEIKNNAWYFFREIARAPSHAGIGSNPVEFNRANIALWWSFFNHVFFILIQPRQTGKSFCTDELMTLLMNFQCNNTQINLLTKDDKLRAENIKRLKDIYDELPPYLKFKTREDANNTEELSVKKLGNTYKTHVPQASEKNAYKIGRGMTTPIFHLDEPPFQTNIHISMPAALAAMVAAIEDAKRAEVPYGVIMTTTAGKKDEKEGKYVHELASDSALWSERFFDASSPETLEKMVRDNSRKKIFRVYAVFSHTQLGKDDDWLREKLELTNSRGEDADRDFFNIWTSGTQTSPLAQIVLDRINRSISDSLYDSISNIGNYILRWYIPENQIETYMKTRKTIVGIDPSDASGGDETSIVIIDVLTGDVIAAGTVNETNLITFSQWLVSFIEKYINTTTIIERRSTGSTILDYLLLFLPQRGIDPFKRLFNWIINDPHEYPERYREATMPMIRRPEDTYTRAKKYFGFATSGGGQTSRTELYSTTLQNAAKKCAEGIHDRQLAGQLSGLITKNGRIDHADGEHDDLVIGWLLSHWLLRMAKNLSHYGIDPRQILVQVKNEKVLDEDEAYEDFIQLRIRTRIEELFLLMSEETDSFICDRYETELKSLDSRLILKDGENFSIDAFMNQIKDKKKQSRNYNSYGYQNDYRDYLGYNNYIDKDRLPSNTIVY